VRERVEKELDGRIQVARVVEILQSNWPVEVIESDGLAKSEGVERGAALRWRGRGVLVCLGTVRRSELRGGGGWEGIQVGGRSCNARGTLGWTHRGRQCRDRPCCQCLQDLTNKK
jgi:hypothetical protein